MDAVRPLWDPKFKGDSPSKTAQKKMMRFAETVDFYDQGFTVKEGDESSVTIKVRKRDSKIVSEVKRRDKYTCQACGFRYEDRIVHVHHLDPLSEQKGIVETKLDNLITLCPNCHALAHALLVSSDKYKNPKRLKAKLGMIFKRN